MPFLVMTQTDSASLEGHGEGHDTGHRLSVPTVSISCSARQVLGAGAGTARRDLQEDPPGAIVYIIPFEICSGTICPSYMEHPETKEANGFRTLWGAIRWETY